MNLLPGVKLWVLAVYAGVALGLVGTGIYLEHGRMQKKLDAETAAFNRFKGGVEALGMEARKEALEKDTWNKLNARKTDEDNARRAADDQRRIAGLRSDADRAREDFLSRLTAATRRADQAEKLGANYQRAYRDLVQEVRGSGDEGSAAVRELDGLKDWAAGRR